MITEFRGPYQFLSNFYPSKILAPTLEHHYQAAKAKLPWHTSEILAEKTAGCAKRAARLVPMRIDWNEMTDDILRPGNKVPVKVRIMSELVRLKFTEPALRDALLATGTEELIEGNRWGDEFWGMTPRVGEGGKLNWHGENHLGKILMKVRQEIRESLRPGTFIEVTTLSDGTRLSLQEQQMDEPRYPVAFSDLENLDNWFSYHPPTENQTKRYNEIREAAKTLALVIIERSPKSADQTATLQKLREVVMAANLTIACNER